MPEYTIITSPCDIGSTPEVYATRAAAEDRVDEMMDAGTITTAHVYAVSDAWLEAEATLVCTCDRGRWTS